MHELSIAISMVEGIIEEAESRGGLKVEAAYVRVGVLSGVDKGALEFCYEIACQDTVLAGTRLVIETVPLQVYCDHCQTNRTPESIYRIDCPTCHSPAQTIVHGRELELHSLEVAA